MFSENQATPNWLLCYLSLQQIEAPFSLCCPMKNFMPLLHCVHHCGANSTKIPNEFSVETSQTMETPYLKNIPRRWPIPDYFHLLRIHLQFIRRDYKTQINEFCLHEGTLLQIDQQLLLL
jgi:hypothetical protein